MSGACVMILYLLYMMSVYYIQVREKGTVWGFKHESQLNPPRSSFFMGVLGSFPQIGTKPPGLLSANHHQPLLTIIYQD